MSNQHSFWLRAKQYIRALGVFGQLLTLLGLLPTVVDIFSRLLGLSLSIPTWVAVIWFVGVFGYANLRIFEAQLKAPSNRKSPLDYELVPISFEIRLNQEIPRIEILFTLINFLPKELMFTSVRVSHFYLSGGPTLEDIPADTEVHITARQTKLLRCSRTLNDSEVRAIAKTQQTSRCNAGLTLSGRGSVGEKSIQYSSSQITINGWISGNSLP